MPNLVDDVTLLEDDGEEGYARGSGASRIAETVAQQPEPALPLIESPTEPQLAELAVDGALTGQSLIQ